MIASRYARPLVLVVTLMLSAAHGAERVTVVRTLPAAVNLSHLKTMAVLPFDGDSGGRVSNAVGTRLQQLATFQLVERAQSDRLTREQQLAVSGLVDESSAAEIGALLGVQGLIYGAVASCRVYDEETTREISWYDSEKYTGKDGKTKTRMVQREEMAPTTIRNGSVDVTIKVTEVATGRLLVQHNESATSRHTQRRHVKSDDKPVPSQDAVEKELLTQVVTAMVDYISPHPDSVEVQVDGACDNDDCKAAMRLMRLGKLDDAQAMLEAQRQALLAREAKRAQSKGEDKGLAAVVYNLGLIAEMKGDLEGAMRLYDEAMVLRIKDPNEKGKEACRRVRAYLDAWTQYRNGAAQ